MIGSYLMLNRHPIMKRLEDFEDSPLLPALLIKVHEEADKVLMDVRHIYRTLAVLSTDSETRD